MNYCFLLMLLVSTVLAYDTFMCVRTMLTPHGRKAWDSMPDFLHPCVVAGPGCAALTIALVAYQVWTHVQEIRDDNAVQRHDRAVQILLLPAVYTAAAMSSLTRMYHAYVNPGPNKSDMDLAKFSAESSFMVGDLYEAWALYQFGLLTMELIESSIAKQGFSEKEDERAAARALMVAHTAVEKLAWVGILAFVVVCAVQSAYALYIMNFQTVEEQEASFDESLKQFQAAGFLASGAAIYNVQTVESTFHHYLESYRPFLKFITVKILVTFAFFQRGFFKVVRGAQDVLPGVLAEVVKKIPFLGTVANFPPEQFEVFYACLLLVECVLVVFMHSWAWSASEEWYDEVELDRREFQRESEAILEGKSPAANQKYGGSAPSAV